MTATPQQLSALDLWPARVLDTPNLRERAFRTIVVRDPDGSDVVVRWRLKADTRAWRWKCDRHRTGPDPDLCTHTLSAAISLAEELLGLHRIPELQPTSEGTP